MDEQLKELFESLNSEIFTEDVQLKMSTLFESAVNEAVQAKEKELEEAAQVEMEAFKENLVEEIDGYLDYFADKYISENEAIVEDFHKVKLAEKVLVNFKQMCEAFNISLSEEVVKDEEELEKLKESENQAVADLIEARKEIQIIKKAAMIAEATGKFEVETQKELFIEQAKALEFDEEVFSEKLTVIADKIITESKSEETDQKLDEKEETVDQKKVISESMQKYLKFLK